MENKAYDIQNETDYQVYIKRLDKALMKRLEELENNIAYLIELVEIGKSDIDIENHRRRPADKRKPVVMPRQPNTRTGPQQKKMGET